MIYFDNEKQAFGYEIENPLCVLDNENWDKFNKLTLGKEYDITEDGIVDLRETKEYKEQLVKEEALRVAKLSLTAADVERALYKAFGKDFDDIVALCEEFNSTGTADIDIKELKIEFKAQKFYRGNPYISQIGALLGISETQLDDFFETNDYKKLLSVSDKKESED